MKKERDAVRSNVISIRVTDEEKAVIEKIRREMDKNLATLIVEALQQYTLWPTSHCHSCFFQGKKDVPPQHYLN